MTLSQWCTCALTLIVVSAVPAQAQVDPVGDWSGALQTPGGSLSLIVIIGRNDDGSLRGDLESPDQAPGRKIPLTGVSVADGRLAFTVAPIKASYEGHWVEAEQHWSGTFTQGLALPLALRRGTPPPRAVIEGLDGHWEGVVTRNGVDLRLVLRVTTGGRGTVATFDAPDQVAYGLPVDELSRTADTVAFRIPASNARFDGRLVGEGRLRGVWRLPGQPEVEVSFERTSASTTRAAPPRPQTPTPPFPYRVEEVTFDNPRASGVTLAGTLTVPEGTGPFPAAVLVTGSGAQDRDETLLGHKPFAVLADYLTRHGIAVLRYDDRGVGRSTGTFARATSADFATDASAAVGYVGTRREIRSGAIGLVGHSEGGMVAAIAAAESDQIAFVVSLAGPGTGLVQLLQSQRRLVGLSQGLSEADLAKTEPVMVDLFAAVAASTSTADAQNRVRALLTPATLATLGVPEAGREVVVQQVATDWFRYFLQYQPSAVLSRIRVPVLALNGTLDRQVPAEENLSAIQAALTASGDVTIRRLEGLNHLFQTATTGAVGEYADISETMSPMALAAVADWIAARFGGR
jgi:fermentation-respiration switch protein FrsA (DUF1100 family)